MATDAAEPSQPVLLIVDADPDGRAETVSALVRRFRPGLRAVNVSKARCDSPSSASSGNVCRPGSSVKAMQRNLGGRGRPGSGGQLE
jgi:hypothetical protein